MCGNFSRKPTMLGHWSIAARDCSKRSIGSQCSCSNSEVCRHTSHQLLTMSQHINSLHTLCSTKESCSCFFKLLQACGDYDFVMHQVIFGPLQRLFREHTASGLAERQKWLVWRADSGLVNTDACMCRQHRADAVQLAPGAPAAAAARRSCSEG